MKRRGFEDDVFDTRLDTDHLTIGLLNATVSLHSRARIAYVGCVHIKHSMAVAMRRADSRSAASGSDELDDEKVSTISAKSFLIMVRSHFRIRDSVIAPIAQLNRILHCDSRVMSKTAHHLRSLAYIKLTREEEFIMSGLPIQRRVFSF